MEINFSLQPEKILDEERKSADMDKELKKISSKIADYSTLEKENRNAACAFPDFAEKPKAAPC